MCLEQQIVDWNCSIVEKCSICVDDFLVFEPCRFTTNTCVVQQYERDTVGWTGRDFCLFSHVQCHQNDFVRLGIAMWWITGSNRTCTAGPGIQDCSTIVRWKKYEQGVERDVSPSLSRGGTGNPFGTQTYFDRGNWLNLSFNECCWMCWVWLCVVVDSCRQHMCMAHVSGQMVCTSVSLQNMQRIHTGVLVLISTLMTVCTMISSSLVVMLVTPVCLGSVRFVVSTIRGTMHTEKKQWRPDIGHRLPRNFHTTSEKWCAALFPLTADDPDWIKVEAYVCIDLPWVTPPRWTLLFYNDLNNVFFLDLDFKLFEKKTS